MNYDLTGKATLLSAKAREAIENIDRMFHWLEGESPPKTVRAHKADYEAIEKSVRRLAGAKTVDSITYRGSVLVCGNPKRRRVQKRPQSAFDLGGAA